MIVLPLVYGLPSILSTQIFIDKTTSIRHLRLGSMDPRSGKQFPTTELLSQYSMHDRLRGSNKGTR